MTTDVVPILHVVDAAAAANWYSVLGFRVEFEHRFEPDLPAYVGLRREGAQIHLSEHAGDARPHGLVYIWVDDVDAVAAAFEAEVEEAPWGREVSLVDIDGNRLRVAAPMPPVTVDDELGADTVEALTTLEVAMWDDATRGDRAWMDDHLTDDFTEFGYSGRSYTRDDVLDLPIGPIEATLVDIAVRSVGRDAALVTYRSVEPRGTALRSSLWRRVAGEWLLAFHQGTPAG